MTLAQEANFEGIEYSGEKPPDPVIAVSSDYVVQAVNRKIVVFNKSGTKLFEQTFNTFFANQYYMPCEYLCLTSITLTISFFDEDRYGRFLI